ncbi:hypothetical protein ACFFH2_01300 [Enterococcus devriesei]|nr:hypothetical protein [Enterococcus devriesei]
MFWNRKDYRQKHIQIIIRKENYVESTSFESTDLSFIRFRDEKIPVKLSHNGSNYYATTSIYNLESSGYEVTVVVDGELCYRTRDVEQPMVTFREQMKAINDSFEEMKKRQRELESFNNEEPNLLEIRLKDTDSVPEVWYRGTRVDEGTNGLVDVYMHWHTRDFNKPTELLATLEFIEGTDIDAKRVEVFIDEEGERGSFNLLKDEIDG